MLGKQNSFLWQKTRIFSKNKVAAPFYFIKQTCDHATHEIAKYKAKKYFVYSQEITYMRVIIFVLKLIEKSRTVNINDSVGFLSST